VHERTGRSWRAVDARALVGAPGTPGGRAVHGELVWLELPENAHRIRPRAFHGRIVAVFGPLPTSVEVHRRLVAAEPLAVIHVDDRLPFSWTKNDGVYPYWVRAHGMPPTLAVPYMEGWRWRREGVRGLKVRVDVDLVAAHSQNVVAEFPGRDPGLPAIALTAHHDTQCGNPGADDNASGVVCLLALARALAGARLRRTVRLISFGAEEQLSVGSFAYVRQHRIKPSAVGLVVNFDSVASPLGHWIMSVPGNTALARQAKRRLAARGLDVAVLPEITPFSDQFPFNRVGVPSLWFMRANFPGGRWQHHSEHDSLDNVSTVEVRRLLDAVYPLLKSLAAQAKWPFPCELPAREQALARRLGRELFG
jgi:Iap family predicted aminopeptidase